ncbi:MAG: response regulator [Anaerolineae bacterium]
MDAIVMLNRAEFERQIHLLMKNLYDFAYLQNTDLARALSRQSGQSIDRSVRQLRTELLDAIEQLKPAANVSPRAKEWRPYTLLYGRYVQGLNTVELVEELTISVRQLRREDKRAIEAVANLLWDKLSGQLAAESVSLPLTGQRREVAEFETEQLISQAQVENIDLSTLVSGILTTLEPVARQHHLTLTNELPDSLPPVQADRVILRQALLSFISHAISRGLAGQVVIAGGAPGSVSLPDKTGRRGDPLRSPTEAGARPAARLDEMSGNAGSVNLSISLRGQLQAQQRAGVGLEVSQRLIASLGGQTKIIDSPDEWRVVISLPGAKESPILVMDDNAGLVELFRRYLAGRPYQLIEAHTMEQAIERARELRPKLMMLDIMMPHQDGWEVLQQLRRMPETKDTPIIICSVLNEPEIAAALGASDYLPKPVTQDALLTKLEYWCGAPPGSGGQPPEWPANNAKPRLG